MTARARTARGGYRCSACGHQTAQWVGRCPSCQAWGTLRGRRPRPPGRAPGSPPARPSAPARRIADVALDTARARPTGVSELDRVLGGGLVPGAVVLLAGEPGVGKSTLLLEVAAKAAAHGRVLYVTGEESAGPGAAARRAHRGACTTSCTWRPSPTCPPSSAHIEALQPELLVVDSVQTMSTADADGAPGGVTQTRAVTVALTGLAKERGLPVLLVGHVTKDGSIAGPRVLEHLVDVVLSFEGDKHSTLRMVRGVKNRFGPADEVGCFELRDAGIVGMPDPSGLFLARFGGPPVPGTAVTVVMDGRRPLPAELQALVHRQGHPQPAAGGERAGQRAGGDAAGRAGEARAGLRLHDAEVYAATVGGMRVRRAGRGPGAGAWRSRRRAATSRCRSDVVVLGEIGLAGEVRRVAGLERRLAEAARLGFTHALVPPDSGGTRRDAGQEVRDVALVLDNLR